MTTILVNVAVLYPYDLNAGSQPVEVTLHTSLEDAQLFIEENADQPLKGIWVNHEYRCKLAGGGFNGRVMGEIVERALEVATCDVCGEDLRK